MFLLIWVCIRSITHVSWLFSLELFFFLDMEAVSLLDLLFGLLWWDSFFNFPLEVTVFQGIENGRMWPRGRVYGFRYCRRSSILSRFSKQRHVNTEYSHVKYQGPNNSALAYTRFYAFVVNRECMRTGIDPKQWSTILLFYDTI